MNIYELCSDLDIGLCVRVARTFPDILLSGMLSLMAGCSRPSIVQEAVPSQSAAIDFDWLLLIFYARRTFPDAHT